MSMQPPFPLAAALAVIAMDGVIYLQHVMLHAVPALWRLHRVHHADPDFDVTTGARFHPLEIILSMLIKFATILLLGPPVVAVVVFEVMLNATSMFNHGNISLPRRADRILRLFVVTPDMHRVHHSVEDDEANSSKEESANMPSTVANGGASYRLRLDCRLFQRLCLTERKTTARAETAR